MLYNAPFGSSDPNASYVNGDPSNAVDGSIPPAAMMEQPQREIVNVVAAAGLTPSGSDLTQLLQAIRGGTLNYFADLSTAPNSIILRPSTPYLSIVPGNVLRFKATFAPTGDTVLQVNNITGIGVRKSAGQKLQGGEWAAGDMVTVEYDGAYLQLKGVSGSGGLLATSNVVLNVPSTLYPTIQSAVIAAGSLILPPGIFGQIQVAAGYVEYPTAVTGPIQLPGQFGERWSIVGPALNGSFPTAADVAGKSNAQVLSMLRSRFQAEVRCVGTSAFEIRSGVWSQIANLLITGDQTNSGGHYGIKVGDWSSRVGMAALGCLNVHVHGFGLDNVRAEQTSVIQGVNLGSTYSSAHDFHISHYSVLENNSGNLLAMYGQNGIVLQNGGQLAIDSASGQIDVSYNLGAGVGSPDYGIVNAYSATGVRIQSNGTWGIQMALYSTVALPSGGQTVFSGNASGDIYMSYASTAVTYGCALPGGASPTRGSGFGNSNSLTL